jgi:hypothetical protein
MRRKLIVTIITVIVVISVFIKPALAVSSLTLNVGEIKPIQARNLAMVCGTRQQGSTTLQFLATRGNETRSVYNWQIPQTAAGATKDITDEAWKEATLIYNQGPKYAECLITFD